MQGDPAVDLDSFRRYFRPGGLWACEAGDTVKRRRLALGFSLERFADVVGLNASTLSRIENGKVVPHISTMALISYMLCMELSEIWPTPSRRRLGEFIGQGAA